MSNYQLSLIQFPAGTWGFVGSVPMKLALVTKDGKTPTKKQFADANQVGAKMAGLKTRSWKTREAALRAAKKEGYPASAIFVGKTNKELAEERRKRGIAEAWKHERSPAHQRAEGARLRREKPLPGLKGNPGLGHGGRLGKLDRKVISAFLDKKPFSGRKLESTGKRLDGMWMGGNGIAEWKGGKIHLHDLGSRAAQMVQRALLKETPKNWLAKAGNPYLGDAVKLAKARRSKPPPLPAHLRKKKDNPGRVSLRSVMGKALK